MPNNELNDIEISSNIELDRSEEPIDFQQQDVKNYSKENTMLSLRTLPFDPKSNAIISEETVKFHYGKHHQGYVNNTNALSKGTEFENACLCKIIMKSEGGLYNNSAQVFNHDFYWDCIAKSSSMSAELKKAIEENFKDFKEEFISSANGLFGSGWVWLCVNAKTKKLEIFKAQNAEIPMRHDLLPILTIDVWEHSYYLDTRNDRPSYVKKFFDNINWEFVSKMYDAVLKDGIEATKKYIRCVHPEMQEGKECCGDHHHEEGHHCCHKH